MFDFLVIGPEGSGTYMLYNALKSVQREGDFVFRKSLPHAGEWPNIEGICDEYDKLNTLFILRDFYATAKSVMARDPQRKVHELYSNQPEAIQVAGYIIQAYGSEYFTYVSYEAFVGSEGYRRWLFKARIGMPYPEDFEVYDGNKKYYE